MCSLQIFGKKSNFEIDQKKDVLQFSQKYDIILLINNKIKEMYYDRTASKSLCP